MAMNLPQGFQVYSVNISTDRSVELPCAEAYLYRWLRVEKGQTVNLPEWQNTIVFLPYPDQQDFSITVNGDYTLTAGDSLNLRNQSGSFQSNGSGIILIAGSNQNNSTEKSAVFTKYDDHYRVQKPWGHELWINGEDKIFNFKEVFLKAGNQTSLQYHNFKQETNFLYAGDSDLVFKADDALANDDVQDKDLGVQNIPPMTALYIVPPTLHRLIAKTDLYLYEAATPFLDDVIRVQDSSGRGNGRIAVEHNTAAA